MEAPELANFYEIRTDIPIPEEGNKNGLAAAIRRMAYGNSIIIPSAQHMSVHTSARSVGAKVKTRSNKDGTITVWRIDPGARGEAPRSSDPRPQPQSAAAAEPGPAAADSDSTTVTPGDARPLGDMVYVLTPEGGLPTGHYVQDGPYGSNIWISDKDDYGRPVNLNKKKTIFD
jgi:hypothetical protein